MLKLYTLPVLHAIQVFVILNAHLEKYYQKPALLESSVPIRNKIFGWLLRIRANATYHVGYPDDTKGSRVKFSHFLSIDTNESNYRQQAMQQQQSPPPQQQQISSPQPGQDGETTQSTISIKRSCKIIIDCLVTENDWSVMQSVLKGLPLILQNKALLRGVDMETLAGTVIQLVGKVNKIIFKFFFWKF